MNHDNPRYNIFIPAHKGLRAHMFQNLMSLCRIDDSGNHAVFA